MISLAILFSNHSKEFIFDLGSDHPSNAVAAKIMDMNEKDTPIELTAGNPNPKISTNPNISEAIPAQVNVINTTGYSSNLYLK